MVGVVAKPPSAVPPSPAAVSWMKTAHPRMFVGTNDRCPQSGLGAPAVGGAMPAVRRPLMLDYELSTLKPRHVSAFLFCQNHVWCERRKSCSTAEFTAVLQNYYRFAPCQPSLVEPYCTVYCRVQYVIRLYSHVLELEP